MKFILFLLHLTTASSAHFNIFESNDYMRTFMSSGSQLNRFFTLKEFWDWFDALRADQENRKLISQRVSIGKSFLDQDMYGYYISENAEEIEFEAKNRSIIFVNALHHAREALTLHMVIYTTIQILKSLRTPVHNDIKELLRDTVIFFVPAVNVDSFTFINNNWRDDKNENILMIRKNRNIDKSCDKYTGGVDLNRNYDYKFGEDETGSSSDPCSEDYRGEFPFSEPETKNIKTFIDEHPNVVSGINIHSYGNLWIYPFNFNKDKKNTVFQQEHPHFFQFIKEFEVEVRKHDHFITFGNSSQTLDYPSNGEAGDWFVGAKDILNMDVELGNKDPDSQVFYPKASIIFDVVDYCWSVMRKFLTSHRVQLSLKALTIYSKNRVFNFQILNKGISSLTNFNAQLNAIFDKNPQNPTYEIFYGIKDDPTYNIKLVHVVENKIGGTLPGRNILELEVEFFNDEDF